MAWQQDDRGVSANYLHGFGRFNLQNRPQPKSNTHVTEGKKGSRNPRICGMNAFSPPLFHLPRVQGRWRHHVAKPRQNSLALVRNEVGSPNIHQLNEPPWRVEVKYYKHGQDRLCWLMCGSQSSMPWEDVSPGPWPRSLWPSNVLCNTAAPHVFELTNRVTTSFTSVRHEADRTWEVNSLPCIIFALLG
jgi:hypothetical protein